VNIMLKLKVSGMTCSGCASAIRRAIGSQAKDARVEVDLARGEVAIDRGPDKAAAIKAIEEAGYDVIGEAA
jgi:copper chaperone